MPSLIDHARGTQVLVKKAVVAMAVLAVVPLAVARAQAEPVPVPTAPAATPPAATAPMPGGGGGEFNTLPDCAPFLSFCARGLSIDVNATPDTGASFRFTITEDGTGATETRDVTEGAPSSSLTSALRTYRARLTTPAAGYTIISQVTCTGESARVRNNVVILDLAIPGPEVEPIDCTFTVKRPGSIQIRQVTSSPASDRPAFSYTTTGSGLSGFDLDNDTLGSDRGAHPSSKTFTGLGVGQFRVAAGRVPGFRLTALSCSTGEVVDLATRRATITLAQGEDVVCTFTQSALASVRVTLDMRPEDPADVAFDTASLGPSPATLDDDGLGGARPDTVLFSNLLPGTRSVRQLTDLSGSGIDLRSITCSGTVLSSSLVTREVSFRLDGGEDMVCTFRNDERGSITIVEDSVPDAATDYAYTSTASPATFTLDDDATPAFPRSLTIPAVPAGSRHAFTQGVPPGSPPWKLLSIRCDTGESTDVATRTATVTVDPGEDVTCTFANAQFQPDVLIGGTANGAFAGDDLRSPTVLPAQTLVEAVGADGQRAVIFVKVQNNSGVTDDLILRTEESGQGLFSVVYKRGSEDVSAAVRSPGGFVFAAVPPGGERTIVVTFTAQNGSVRGTGRNANLTVTSATAPAATDVVRARAERT